MTTTDTTPSPGTKVRAMVDGREMLAETLTILASKAKPGDVWLQHHERGDGRIDHVTVGSRWVTLWGGTKDAPTTLGKVEIGTDILIVRSEPSPAQRFLDEWTVVGEHLAREIDHAEGRYAEARAAWLAGLEKSGVISHMEWHAMDLVMAEATRAQWAHIRTVSEKRPDLDIVAATAWLAYRTADRLIDTIRPLSGSSSAETRLTKAAVREAEARWVQDAYVQWATTVCPRPLADEMVGGRMIVHVVSTRTEGTGGFQWFYEEADARAHYEAEQRTAAGLAPAVYVPRYIGEIDVPRSCARADDKEQRDAITHWLDTEGVELWDFDVASDR